MVTYRGPNTNDRISLCSDCQCEIGHKVHDSNPWWRDSVVKFQRRGPGSDNVHQLITQEYVVDFKTSPVLKIMRLQRVRSRRPEQYNDHILSNIQHRIPNCYLWGSPQVSSVKILSLSFILFLQNNHIVKLGLGGDLDYNNDFFGQNKVFNMSGIVCIIGSYTQWQCLWGVWGIPYRNSVWWQKVGSWVDVKVEVLPGAEWVRGGPHLESWLWFCEQKWWLMMINTAKWDPYNLILDFSKTKL